MIKLEIETSGGQFSVREEGMAESESIGPYATVDEALGRVDRSAAIDPDRFLGQFTVDSGFDAETAVV